MLASWPLDEISPAVTSCKLARGRLCRLLTDIAATYLDEIFQAVTYCIINWLEADLSSFDRYWQPHL